MTEIYSIDKSEREILFPLFKENRYDTVVMKSILEGHSGHAYSDSKTKPTVSRLDSGAYTILGGNPNSIAAIELVRHAPISVVTPENKIWEKLLYNEFKDRISYQPFDKLLPYSLSKEYLFKLAINIDDDYKILRIDKELANQLPIDINNNYFFEHFCSIDDFLTRGIGFCVKYNNRIISAVTSMAASEKMINIEIETHSEFKNKNLGTAVSAKLLLYCLENDIEAQWLSANDISEKLALKLGYIKAEFYKTFLIN
ncbi:hypothetical protein GCM10008908_00150 [Clostridium subterminale]|uniref:GNAT family N-acetyltransferase n=1 Tax=Clostridium subterminale TaxID=1550 RepID=A0ABN1KEY0_CLOSU